MQSPMADYDIFRERLAIKYPSYGHALQILSLFNALLSEDDPSHVLGVPEYHEPLVPALLDHLDTRSLVPNNYYSPGSAWADPGYIPGDAQVSFGVKSKGQTINFQFYLERSGAVLCLGLRGRYVYMPFKILHKFKTAWHDSCSIEPARESMVFIRGFRVVRSFWILPRHPRGDDYGPDTEVISIPANSQVKDSVRHCYIAEVTGNDCDSVLVHDDDLGGLADLAITVFVLTNRVPNTDAAGPVTGVKNWSRSCIL
ncbi:hypothetical protein BGY98DRAFT_963209, partial [Russula aff. rugulosa BPL654]